MTDTNDGVASAMSAGLGQAIIVDGEIVAWFKYPDEEAREWCSYNHTGKWMAWRATPPVLVPLTPDEQAKVDIEAARLHEAMKELIEPPNVEVSR